MKRVAIITRKPLRVNTRIFKQARSLIGAGYHVRLIGIWQEGLKKDERKDGYRITRLKLRTMYLKRRQFGSHSRENRNSSTSRTHSSFKTLFISFIRPFYRIVIAFEYLWKVYALCRNYDIDIVHANDLDVLFAAYIVARRHRAKLLYDAQEMYTEIHTISRPEKFLLSLQEAFFSKRADKVTAVNEMIAGEMERRNGIKVDEVIINTPPYEDIGLWADDKDNIREAFKIPPDTRIIVFSGGLSKHRGIENTLLALKQLKSDVHLLCLGDGNLKEHLRALISDNDLAGRVHFYGYIPHKDVPRFLHTATVGIVPYEKISMNHYFASPSKLFHYIMAGLPVIVSDFPFLRKIVVENKIGATFDPSDPKSIARAMSFVLDEGRLRMLKQNVFNARKQYCWENEEKKFLKLYSELTA